MKNRSIVWKYVVCVLLGIVISKGYAQNLVLNPSFEQYDTCFFYYSGITDHKCIAWSAPSPGTSDYFNSCSSGYPSVGVPSNVFGYQQARTGNAYAGMYLHVKPSTSTTILGGEYIQGQLSQSLAPNKAYTITYYVSPIFPADYTCHQNLVTYNIGVHFDSDSLYTYALIFPYPPQVVNHSSNVISDTSTWTAVKGVYVAQGGEKWIIIGGFSSDTAVFQVDASDTCGYQSYKFIYVYVDDVSIEEIQPEEFAHYVSCEEKATLSGQMGFHFYQWNTADTTQQITVTISGKYWIRQYRNDTLRVDTFHVEILPPFSAGDDVGICEGQSVAELAASAGYMGYLWSSGDTSRNLTVSEAGVYTVQALDRCGLLFDTVLVYNIDTLHVSLGGDVWMCEGRDTVALAAGGGFLSYLWSTGATDSSIFLTEAELYVVTATGACGTQSDSVKVTNIDTLHLSLPPAVGICPMQEVATLVAPAGYATYSWNTGATTPTLTVGDSGLYILRVVDACGIEWDSTHVFFKDIPPAPAVRDTFYCQGTSPAALGAAGENLAWLPSAIPSTEIEGVFPYTVSQTVEGCKSEAAVLYVSVVSPPAISPPPPFRICENDSIRIAISDNPAYQYSWSTGVRDSAITLYQLGEYYVSVYNKCGEQTIPIVVAHLDCELGVFIPTAFSPNGDGVNEYFAPVFSHLVSDYHLEIYDRWGKRCYISENASARWDGKYLSQDVPEGVFTYHLRYRFNQKQNERTGTITVVR